MALAKTMHAFYFKVTASNCNGYNIDKNCKNDNNNTDYVDIDNNDNSNNIMEMIIMMILTVTYSTITTINPPPKIQIDMGGTICGFDSGTAPIGRWKIKK